MDQRIVWQSMAGDALWHPLMLILVTVNTEQSMMLAVVLLQLGKLSSMATGTEPRWDKTIIGNLERFMRLMTPPAILDDHLRDMRLMAYQAFQKLPMLLVTFLTIKQRMTAGIILKLAALMRMTGNTGGINTPRSTKINISRVVRRMTTQTVINGKMIII